MAKAQELSSLIKWSERDDWRDLFDEVLDDHFGPAFEAYGLDFEKLEELVGEIVMNALWGCAFEDFLTRPQSEEDEQTIVDDYLKRRGWKETPSTRRFMEGLRDSLFSLHEVSDVVPGQSMQLRDLIRGGDPVQVSEHTATRMLKDGDRIGARVVEVVGKRRMAGGLLRFSQAAADAAIETIGGEMRRLGEAMASEEAPADAEALDGIDMRELSEAIYLHGSAPEFTNIWLEDELRGRLEKVPPPRFNGDGEELSFHTVTYPLTAGITEKAVCDRLDGLPDLCRDTDAFVWNWIDAEESDAGRPPSAAFTAARDGHFHIELEDGTPVLASIEVTPEALVLSVNSKLRADRAKVMLKSALKGMLAQPSTEVHSYEQLVRR